MKQDDPTHKSLAARQGGNVGVKDMLFDNVRRLAVRTQGTEGAEGIGSVYLTVDECRDIAVALTEPSRFQPPPAPGGDLAAVVRELREIASELEGSYCGFVASRIGKIATRLDALAAGHEDKR